MYIILFWSRDHFMYKIKYMSEIWIIIACVVYIFSVYTLKWVMLEPHFFKFCVHPSAVTEWIVTEITLSYPVTTTTCILTRNLTLYHNTQNNRLKFAMSILWKIVILVQIRRRSRVPTNLLSRACGPGSLASHVSHWTAEGRWCRGGAPEDRAAETPERQGTR